jgi:hypothetical protein
MSNVLHGLVANGEADSTFKEIARVTAPIVEFRKQESPHGPPLSIRLSSEDIEALAGGYGFSKENVEEVGPYHYAIVFRKK